MEEPVDRPSSIVHRPSSERWHESCEVAEVVARNLAELLVYKKAMKANEAVSAMVGRSAFSRHLTLRDQLSRSSMRVAPLIAEGFGQLTDRHLAVYLGRARGSVFESIGHLQQCIDNGLISADEHLAVVEAYDHIGRMLTRWINYLQQTDWKDRG